MSWCIYTTMLERILARMSKTSHAPRAWWLATESYASAPPPLPPVAAKQNTLYNFSFARPLKNFSIKEKSILLGSASNESGGGATTLGRLGIPPPDPLLPSRPRLLSLNWKLLFDYASLKTRLIF